MKGGIIIVFFIIILIIGGILEQNYITTTMKTLEEQVTYFQTMVKEENSVVNNENILIEFNKINTTWRKHEKKLCLFLNHQTLDEVNKELSKIENAIKYDNKEQIEESNNLIINFVNGYRDYAVISWESVF